MLAALRGRVGDSSQLGSLRAACISQALAYLGTVWSVDLKARLHFKPVRQLADATHVKVVPHSFVGTKGIVPLHGKATVSEMGVWVKGVAPPLSGHV